MKINSIQVLLTQGLCHKVKKKNLWIKLGHSYSTRKHTKSAKCTFFVGTKRGNITFTQDNLSLVDFYSPCSMKKRRYHPKETKSVGKLLCVIVMIYFSTSYNYLSFSTLGNQIKSELKAPIQFCHPVPLYGADPIVNQNSKQPGNDRNLNYYSPDYLFTFLLISFRGCFNLKRELSCFVIGSRILLESTKQAFTS